MKDKRQHARVESKIRCWCEGENVTFYARVANLSEGGLFLRTSTPLPRGAEATLRFTLSSDQEITTRAKVVWTRAESVGGGPAGMGLSFVRLDPDGLAGLRRIIDIERRSRGAV